VTFSFQDVADQFGYVLLIVYDNDRGGGLHEAFPELPSAA
jgi:hypothetical protein